MANVENRTPTEEELEEMVLLVRLLVGDLQGSIFFPVMSDGEIEKILKLEKYNVQRAARRVAMGIAFYLTTTNYKERTGDIEVINNASIQYGRVLRDFIKDGGQKDLPDDLNPYVGGASIRDICRHINDPDVYRSPLVQISPCVAWWTDVKHKYDCSSRGC